MVMFVVRPGNASQVLPACPLCIEGAGASGRLPRVPFPTPPLVLEDPCVQNGLTCLG